MTKTRTFFRFAAVIVVSAIIIEYASTIKCRAYDCPSGQYDRSCRCVD